MDVTVFHKLLTSAIQKGASDIHLQVGYPPLLRVNGELLEVKYHPLTPDETTAIAEEVLSNTYRQQNLADISEMDVSYGIEGQGRFRVNLFRQRGSFSVVLRVIPITIKNFKELNLPPVLEQVANLRRGLVLVAGATGNGKSTTLAAIIEHINESRRAHILTIEDPIEFLFKHKMSVISQRELGSDTPSYSKALHSSLRQDPDVIMIGEMRDPETVEIALKSAETGHLVLSTLHTTDAVKTIARLIGFYPPDQEATDPQPPRRQPHGHHLPPPPPHEGPARPRPRGGGPPRHPDHPGVHPGPRQDGGHPPAHGEGGRDVRHADLRPAPPRPREGRQGGHGVGQAGLHRPGGPRARPHDGRVRADWELGIANCELRIGR